MKKLLLIIMLLSFIGVAHADLQKYWAANRGGTGADSSAATGIASVSSGAWSWTLTPSFTATNLTGTAASLNVGYAALAGASTTAGNAATVTTNANLTGDVTSVGNATTLATVNSNTGSFGSSTSIPSFTVNGKGLITAASGNAVIAPAGTLTGATLSSSVTASSLTSIGNGAALQTPASIILTNATGTASSLTAGNANNVATTSVSNNATYYLLFASSTANSNQPVDLNSTVNYNPSTGTLSATNISGTLTNGTTATTQSTSDSSTSVSTTAFVKNYCASGPCIKTIGFSSLFPSTGQQGTYWFSPCAGAISGWDFAVDAGTATVQTWKIATGTASPTSGNSISSSGVSISSGTALHSTSLGDFTTLNVAAYDMFAFNLSAVSGVNKLAFALEIKCN